MVVEDRTLSVSGRVESQLPVVGPGVGWGRNPPEF